VNALGGLTAPTGWVPKSALVGESVAAPAEPAPAAKRHTARPAEIAIRRMFTAPFPFG
jgi:hypothetical protein